MCKELKYSIQRERLYNLLKSTKTHPTAEQLYSELKKENKTISLATVYRNLRLLCSKGKVITVDCSDNKEHFDADVSEHGHFVCNKCGKIFDFNLQGISEFEENAVNNNDFQIERASIVFYGLCKNCKKG